MGWGCPTLVRRSHFNMETSASLNSGFNVLEALRFLLQLFLFIHNFLYTALKMSLTSPKFLPAPAVQWIRGKREGLEAAVSEVCVHQVSRGRRRPWSNAVPLLPVPISFPHHFSLCSKNICTYDTLLHVGCSPSVVLREKGERNKRQNRKKRKAVPCDAVFLSEQVRSAFPWEGSRCSRVGGRELELCFV